MKLATRRVVTILGVLGLVAGCLGEEVSPGTGVGLTGDGGADGGGVVTPDASADARPPRELDCSNGSDDDGDGLVDCADPDCTTVACVDPAPAGWSGMFQLYEGTPDKDQGCAGAYAQSTFQGGKDLEAQPVTCSACACTAPAAASVGACPDKLEKFTNGTCTGVPSSVGALTGDGQPNGGILGGTTSVRITPRVCNPSGNLNNDVKCAVSTASAPVTTPPPVWKTRARLCGLKTPPAAAGCTDGKICQPKPEAPGVSTLCISKAGTNTCPTGYYSRGVYHGGTTDTRSCTACTCGALTSATLTTTMSLQACSGAFCESGTSSNIAASTMNGTACVATPAPNNLDMGWMRSAVTALANTVCGAPAGGAATGSVTPDAATAVTVCCIN